MTNIRNLDPELWQYVRLEAVRLNISAGVLLSRILAQWRTMNEAKA